MCHPCVFTDFFLLKGDPPFQTMKSEGLEKEVNMELEVG